MDLNIERVRSAMSFRIVAAGSNTLIAEE
ncbi:MAG: hypothetical protein H6Q72_4914, partial [Firmicutes bacterium]|nr:hypothetical protein [Bacillota bacterium]